LPQPQPRALLVHLTSKNNKTTEKNDNEAGMAVFLSDFLAVFLSDLGINQTNQPTSKQQMRTP
jgi:hypothetical protein